ANLQAVCEAAGTTLARAARLTVYMTDLSAFAEVNEVYARWFDDEPPARAAVGVAQLPRGAYVGIDAVGALEGASSSIGSPLRRARARRWRSVWRSSGSSAPSTSLSIAACARSERASAVRPARVSCTRWRRRSPGSRRRAT